jgi:3-hydroxybutyryl-CoA dehydratase
MYALTSLHTNRPRRPRLGSRIARGRLAAGLTARLRIRAWAKSAAAVAEFLAPVKVGQRAEAIPEIADLNPPRKSVTLGTRFIVKEDVVMDGEACVPASPRL